MATPAVLYLSLRKPIVLSAVVARGQNSDRWQAIEDYEIQNHNDGYLVRLAGVDQREAAQQRSGSLLGVPSHSGRYRRG